MSRDARECPSARAAKTAGLKGVFIDHSHSFPSLCLSVLPVVLLRSLLDTWWCPVLFVLSATSGSFGCDRLRGSRFCKRVSLIMSVATVVRQVSLVWPLNTTTTTTTTRTTITTTTTKTKIKTQTQTQKHNHDTTPQREPQPQTTHTHTHTTYPRLPSPPPTHTTTHTRRPLAPPPHTHHHRHHQAFHSG